MYVYAEVRLMKLIGTCSQLSVYWIAAFELNPKSSVWWQPLRDAVMAQSDNFLLLDGLCSSGEPRET